MSVCVDYDDNFHTVYGMCPKPRSGAINFVPSTSIFKIVTRNEMCESYSISLTISRNLASDRFQHAHWTCVIFFVSSDRSFSGLVLFRGFHSLKCMNEPLLHSHTLKKIVRQA